MKSALWLTVLAAVPAVSFAWGDGCQFKADRAGGEDARGVDKVVIRTGAGDMKIVGRTNAVRVEARGTACASKQELADQVQISVRREGNVVFVETAMPQNGEGWKLMNNEYAYIDIGIAVPSSLPLEVEDTSGDVTIEDVGALKLVDSSGDIEIARVAGDVDVTDSSGDVDIQHAGSVRLRDSSGDMDVTHVKGSVLVVNDSSGDIEIEDVQSDVNIESDSSGGIRVEEVRGNVLVESDSSGDIYAGRVGGNFTVKADTSGSIGHDSVAGKVSVPSNKRSDADVDVE